MSNGRVYVEGEMYVKVNPTDNTQEIEQAKEKLPKLLEELNELIAKIEDLKVASEEDMIKYITKYHQFVNMVNVSKMGKHDYIGMNSFWFLNIVDNKFILTSLREYKGEPYFIKGFKTPEEMDKEFRPLIDIMQKEEFIGKKLGTISFLPGYPDCSAYVLYELENLAITGYVDEKMNIKRVLPGIKLRLSETDTEPLKIHGYVGESVPELNNHGKILRLLYKQRLDVEKGD